MGRSMDGCHGHLDKGGVLVKEWGDNSFQLFNIENFKEGELGTGFMFFECKSDMLTEYMDMQAD